MRLCIIVWCILAVVAIGMAIYELTLPLPSPAQEFGGAVI
jgi:hypothetical protein